MKMRTILLASLLALSSTHAQTPQPRLPQSPPQPIPPQPGSPSGTFSSRLNQLVAHATGPQPELTKFTLDFPGGTPKQLAAAIEKSMGRPLNVIVADEYANTKLPPLKMNDVTVPQLFAALVKTSYKYDANRNVIGSYGFETESAQPTEDSIWQFYTYSGQAASALTRFDLDFPGGTPKQLVAAIEKATKKPLNAVIPPEHAEMKLPPLKMSEVTVPLLFQALISASRKTIAYTTGSAANYPPGYSGIYQQMVTTYGFRCEGAVSDSSIWHFYVESPNLPPVISTAKACRFYPLSPYLERGLTVDDIITAIQTGWKMLGEKDTPTINFHKDTRLLIAVGEPAKLELIDAALKALQSTRPAKPGAELKVTPVRQTDAAPTPDKKTKTED